MAGALEDCLVVAGGLEAVEPKRKVVMNMTAHKIDQFVTFVVQCPFIPDICNFFEHQYNSMTSTTQTSRTPEIRPFYFFTYPLAVV